MITNIRKTFTALLLAVVFVLSCVGCSSGGTSGPDASASPEAAGDNGGAQRTDLSIRIPDSFTTVDPQGWNLDTDYRLCCQIYEPLYRVGSDRTETPVLATGYTVSDDYKSVEFKLLDDVYFSNGDKLTASDVKFSIERTKASAYLSSNLTTVESVDADDANGTVTVHLTAPTPGIIENISWVLIVDQKFVEENKDENGLLGFKACGTGPYTMKDYTPDDSISLVSNPDYRGGEAAIKTLNFHLITDENTAVTAFQAGELDIARMNTSNWENLKSDTNFKTAELPTNHVTYIIMNTQKAPFDNKLLRQAVACAVNRDDIIAMSMDGRASATYTVVTPYMVGYADIEPQFTYDTERAKELLSEAGYPDGLDIGEIMCLSGTYFEDVFEVVQQELAEVGITCTVSGLEANTLIASCMGGTFDMANIGQTNTYDMSWLTTYYGTESIGAMNMAQYSVPEVDAKLKEAAVCIDPDERSALYKEILETVDEDCGYVPLFNKILCMAWAGSLNYTPQARVDLYYDCSWN